MFSFFKKKPAAIEVAAHPAEAAAPAPRARHGTTSTFVAPPMPPPAAPAPIPAALASPPVAVETEKKQSWMARLKSGLSKTSSSLSLLFVGARIDDALFEELEAALLMADAGIDATAFLLAALKKKVREDKLLDAASVKAALKVLLTDLLTPLQKPFELGRHQPMVMMISGVNGAGKTTTIGKLAKKLQMEGKKVMLAAGDTFRAAAVEQLQVWGERNRIPVIAQHTGADSASVIFDAVQAAKARGVDVLIADTAGRLHTKDNLMEELKKVRRVIGKLDPDAPHEVLLVLDAGTGQNAMSQAKYFHQSVELTGLALTKLDGTAKGGVIFALAKQFKLPIRFIGVGEGIDDLRTFEAEPFVKALFAERD